jgi:hypothetical protein
MSIKYFGCVSVFLPYLSDIHSAYALLYWYLWPVWTYNIFPHYLIHGTIFGKRLLNMICVFWFPIQFKRKKNRQAILINVHRSSCKVPVILVRFWTNLNFLDEFSKIFISNFMKIRPVGAEFFHPDRHDEASNRFSQFCKRTKDWGTLRFDWKFIYHLNESLKCLQQGCFDLTEGKSMFTISGKCIESFLYLIKCSFISYSKFSLRPLPVWFS